MKPYHVVADGFSRLHITSYNPTAFATPADETAQLEAFTRQQVENASRRGGIFFDGSMVGALTGQLAADPDDHAKLNVATQNMRYSQHAGLFRKDVHAPIQALYVASLTITRDGKLVFGATQATEADWMGKLGLGAGGVTIGPDGMPSFGTAIYQELGEEFGIAPDYQLTEQRSIPGWITGMSRREGNYHFSTAFVTPLRLTSYELAEYFADWSAAQTRASALAGQRGERVKTEFKELKFLPNDAGYIDHFVREQDSGGKNANLLGKSLDIVDEWARTYQCDIERLKESKKNGARVYLPQPSI